MTGSPSSMPPAPYADPSELDPMSPNFNPDLFAESVIAEETVNNKRHTGFPLEFFEDMIPADRRKIRTGLTPGDVTPDKAADLLYSTGDSDLRGIYEDMALDMDLGTSGIDREEAEEAEEAKKVVAPPPKDVVWDQDFAESQELLRQLEAGEVILPPDEDDEEAQSR